MTTTKRKKTAYQALVSKKKKYCEGRCSKADLNRVASRYKKDALKKGKSKADVTKTINKVLKGGCTIKKKTSKNKK